MDLQPHQKRVVDECAELEYKIGSLKNFIESDRFAVLGDEQTLLLMQLGAMEHYRTVLFKRMELWGML